MSSKMTRVMISVPEDIRDEVERLKREKYEYKPYVDVYRLLIRLGLERLGDAEKAAEAEREFR